MITTAEQQQKLLPGSYKKTCVFISNLESVLS